MRRNLIVTSHSVTLQLVTDTGQESEAASSPFGPVKAGLITMQTTHTPPLSELLSCLERKIEMLVSKSYEDLNISTHATEGVLAELCASTIDTDTTK
jgi:hypothetical protein